jgi:hypothetical protein
MSFSQKKPANEKAAGEEREFYWVMARDSTFGGGRSVGEPGCRVPFPTGVTSGLQKTIAAKAAPTAAPTKV